MGNSGAGSEREKEEIAEQLCRHYIAQKVSGVFFAPVEFSEGDTRRIIELLRTLTGRESPSCFSTGVLNLIRDAATMTWLELTIGELRIWRRNT